jgi:Na+-driven multidrug efflux pump
MKAKELFDLSHLSIYDEGKRISIFSLAFPTLIQHILTAVIGTVNTAMISGYAEDAVGAISACSQIITLANAIAAMITVGSNVSVNIELGRGNRKRAAQLAGTSLICSTVLGLIISIAFALFAENILTAMKIEGEALVHGTSYLTIYGGAIALLTVSSSLTSLIICYGYTLQTMIKNIGCTAIGVLCGYLFLKIDLIPWLDGTVAVSVGNVVSLACNLTASVVLVLRSHIPIAPCADISTIWRILKIGIPGGVPGISYMLAQTVTTSLMAQISIETLNTKSYVSTIVQYTYFVSYALATGVQIMMGRYAGQGNIPAMKRLASTSIIIAVLSNGVCSAAVLLLHRPLLSMFTSNSEIIGALTLVFVIDIAVEIIRAVNHVLEWSLNAARNVYTTLAASIISCWVGSVLLTYVFGIRLGMGLTGCWLAFAIDELIKASIYAVRWFSGKWQKGLISQN